MDLNKIKRFFTHEWQSKLISLLLAAGFWFYVTYFENRTDYNLSIPIRYENLSADKVIVYSSLNNAFIILPLRRDQKQSVDFNKEIKARVDLKGAIEGAADYKIELIYDKDLNVTPRIKQNKVNVIIDKKVFKTVPLKEKVVGSPADGYYLEEVVLSEKNISVSGPGQRMEEIQNLETESIDINGISNSLDLRVKVNHPAFLQLQRKQPINAQVIIKEMLIEKEISLTPGFKNLKDNLSAVPLKDIKLKITTPGRYLKNISKTVSLYIDCSSVTGPGSYNLKITPVYPSGITISPFDQTVTVQIQ